MHIKSALCVVSFAAQVCPELGVVQNIFHQQWRYWVGRESREADGEILCVSLSFV